jgi:hypothetical protein
MSYNTPSCPEVMVKTKVFVAAILSLTAIFLAANYAWASEGTAELTSPTGTPARCYVSSVLMENYKYSVVVSCRDLIYPPAENLFSYVLWANPLDGKNPEKLGELGVGKAEFTTKKPFSDLFVTAEAGKQARSPSTNLVMQGQIEKISFLDKTPEQVTVSPEEEVGEEVKEEETAPAPGKERLLVGLRRVALITVLALVVAAGLIFFITRFRK